MEHPKRQSWPDNLRIIATVAMVLLHVTSPILYKFGAVSAATWHLGNIIDSSVRFCVPVFVMLSGALLLGKEYHIRYFLKKRVIRVLLPFMFWSVVYIGYDLIKYPQDGYQAIFELVWNKIAHGAAYHFWYIYMIIGLYLFIPIISKAVRACTEKEVRYFLFIWMGTMVVSHPILFRHKPNFDLSYFSGFLGYLVLGYYLSLKRKQGNWPKLYSWLSLIAGIAITILGTWLYTQEKGQFDSLFYGFLTPNVLLTASGVFMLVSNFEFKFKIFESIRSFVCKYSFGIYLVHVLVLSELAKKGLNCFWVNPATGIVVTLVTCLGISGMIVWLVNKLPGGKYISG